MRARHPVGEKGLGGTIGSSMPGQATYTYADLAALPEDNIRREILDGELIVSPSPKLRHQRLVVRLTTLLQNHVEAHGGGEVFAGPSDVVLSEINVLVPDVLVVSDAQHALLNEKNIAFAPALVIEVVSNPRMDRVRKRDIYARFGVPEYWVVDPDTDRIEVYRLLGEAYAKPELFESGDRLAPAVLPALSIDLARLFRR